MNTLGLGLTYESTLEAAAFTVVYDLLKLVAKEIWHAYTARKRQRIDQIYPCHLGKRMKQIIPFDDETEGIRTVLKDCWPETLSTAFEHSGRKALKDLNSFEKLDDFYSTSRKVMAENRKKEIILFRHNAFDIVKEDYPYVVRALKKRNQVRMVISGTMKTLKESTLTELDFLQDNQVTQKILLQMGHFSYSNDFDLNLLKNCFDSLLSLALLLDLMRMSKGNLTISLNKSLSTIRGQVIEDGDTFLVRFPKRAPEHLGLGYSSESDKLRNRLLVEMSDWKSLDVPDEETLAEITKRTTYHVQDLIDRNYNLGNITKGRKTLLENTLDSLGPFDTSQDQVKLDELENVYRKVCTTVLESKKNPFKIYEYWKKYEKIRNVFAGNFDDFLNEYSEFLVKKCRIKDSETELCFFFCEK